MTLFALLVGINDYADPLPKLRGCVNDAHSLLDYLQSGVTGDVRPFVLLDQEAKREAVIAEGRDHLGQAGAGDTAFGFRDAPGAKLPTLWQSRIDPPEAALSSSGAGVIGESNRATSRRPVCF